MLAILHYFGIMPCVDNKSVDVFGVLKARPTQDKILGIERDLIVLIVAIMIIIVLTSSHDSREGVNLHVGESALDTSFEVLHLV